MDTNRLDSGIGTSTSRSRRLETGGAAVVEWIPGKKLIVRYSQPCNFVLTMLIPAEVSLSTSIASPARER